MKTAKDRLLKIPKSPGVYFFKNTGGEIIYIGKAVNLKERVKSYFSQKLYGLKAVMIPEIAKIDYKLADTEIDALILESQYIKKHRPKYNVMLKDDKNYFYVVITPHPSRIAQGANPQLSLKGEGPKFPKIFITHQPFKIRNGLSFPRKRESRFDLCLDPRLHGDDKGKGGDDKWDYSDLFYMGPYTDGQALKTTLRFLRKIFPYCTCKSQHKLPCLKSHLGLCLGICCVDGSKRIDLELKKHYFANIKSIVDILSGRKKGILVKLEKEMKTAAEKEDFEKAAEIRNKISALKNIFKHKIAGKIDEVEPRQNCRGSTSSILAMAAIGRIFGVQINRIEFYDISNIQGQLATGSMIVFDNGKIHPHTYSSSKHPNNINAIIGVGVNKSQYRKFKIKTVHQADDPAMMKEVLERRLKHTEWPMPDLIVVDGGITQLNAARDVLARFCHSRPSFCHPPVPIRTGYRGDRNPEIASSLAMTEDLDPRFHGDDRGKYGDDRKKVKIASLAKNPDRLFLSPIKAIALKDLPDNARLLLQNLRDEAHRFAIGYHKKLRSQALKNQFFK